MKVHKRSGDAVPMLFDKVTKRISKLNEAPEFAPLKVQPDKVAQKVFTSMYDGISTTEIDNLTAEVAVGMITEDPDYETLAMRVTVSNLQKTSPKTFSDAMVALHVKGIVSDHFMKCVALEIDSWIQPKRDYLFGYFGIRTLQKGYLNEGETPQYLFMRVAVGIHGDDLPRVRETYDLMSQKFFTHATPTLFNAGTNNPQMSSCFLVAMKDDSIEGIYETLKECAHISKWSGGIGIHCSNIRSSGTRINGTNGVADGIVPMLRVFNNTARYVNQGGGKRKGSFAIYLEPWHADVMDFLELRLNQGDEEMRCRDLFTALWIPDLFMEKVEKDEEWHLMCPHECPGLPDVYGEAFNELYRTYVAQGRFKKVVRARDVWDRVLKSQVETGTPYMCYKDAANAKSNQKNIGAIKSSNLCTEIMEVSKPDETAVCNLASLCLPTFVKASSFDFAKLYEVTRVVTRNLNRVIDRNFYPTEAARKSNMRHRPIAIGVQGLADVFMMLGLSFDDPKARELNKGIFEAVYHAALLESCELAKEDGPYETFKGSPASEGILQPDMWGVTENEFWSALKVEIKTHGLRNSLLVAPMPTASTAQIMGNNEAFEPYTTNIYLRRTLAGEFVMVNKHLVRDLQKIDMWSPKIKNEIVRAGGSVQALDIPQNLKDIYRTVWEIPQKSIIDMAADRGAYIDQSQSLNVFMENPSLAKLSSMHMYGWHKGLKTGMYYLRTRAKAKAQQVTVPVAPTPEQILACSRENPESCAMCSG
ncbi:putative ribonucleotide reductase large subunit [Yellowstone lake phycodnavirus 3]|jgi:ribonucleoside-diphosphate reductase alpha subunit|uniref:ribonucleotide reductase n=1 Tax=Yellowstone lake phycodnavirus 3 TaxID=1586715 RepID=UPI0006EB69BE|nr:ribonucleotide reductase [Yellowstone lake phycodnavirus 3]BAT22531.1 putative ribonucleotide reductase large subunit [Yellowstone lake phycodnavirus 3]